MQTHQHDTRPAEAVLKELAAWTGGHASDRIAENFTLLGGVSGRPERKAAAQLSLWCATYAKADVSCGCDEGLDGIEAAAGQQQ